MRRLGESQGGQAGFLGYFALGAAARGLASCRPGRRRGPDPGCGIGAGPCRACGGPVQALAQAGQLGKGIAPLRGRKHRAPRGQRKTVLVARRDRQLQYRLVFDQAGQVKMRAPSTHPSVIPLLLR